jgi:putative peptidoglycan lipid II flippase
LFLIVQLPFLIFGNVLSGIGQANKIFILSSIAPVIYNVAIIVSTLLLASQFALMAPVVGVLLGAILFFLIQLPIFAKSHFTYKLLIKKSKGLIEFIRMVLPRAFTVVVGQIDATVDLSLTTLLGSGAYTVFYFAQHLQLLPVSVIGIAFGQASLPYISQMYQENKIDEFKKIIIQSILNLFFFTIPIMSFFIFARTPVVRLFFGGEKFDWAATVATAYTLSYFSFALPFHAIYYFITRCFYALLDSKTPFLISVLTILINTGLSLYLVLVAKLPVWALAGAFAGSMILNVCILVVLLSNKLKGLDFKLLSIESFKMIAVTLISSLAAYYFMKLLDGLVFDTSYTINVFLLLVTTGIVYCFLYLFLAWIFDVKEIYLMSKIFLKAKEYQKRIMEFYTVYE